MPTVTSLCEETDISYRQANFWIKQGYIPDVHPIGSGYPLSLNGYQAQIFRVIAALVTAGMRPSAASEYANNYFRVSHGLPYTFERSNDTHIVEVSIRERLPSEQRQD